ncbi:MAG: hypothetical protein LBK61_12920 [Spirochaetaceae bacterium]|jgi:hypothetical protein|nr:hypothetical protein [Spirochaetaceae bacterium]
MTNKKFLFIGMAVLLSASLFFLGCDTGGDDPVDGGDKDETAWYDVLGTGLTEMDNTVTLTAANTPLGASLTVPAGKTLKIDKNAKLTVSGDTTTLAIESTGALEGIDATSKLEVGAGVTVTGLTGVTAGKTYVWHNTAWIDETTYDTVVAEEAATALVTALGGDTKATVDGTDKTKVNLTGNVNVTGNATSVEAGVTLAVPSGVELKVTGTLNVSGTVTVASGGILVGPVLNADGSAVSGNTVTYGASGKVELLQGAKAYYGDSLFLFTDETGLYKWDSGDNSSKVTLKPDGVTEVTAGKVTAQAATGIATGTSIEIANGATLTIANSVQFPIWGTLVVKDGGTLKAPALTDGEGAPLTGDAVVNLISFPAIDDNPATGKIELEQGANGYYGTSFFVGSTNASLYKWDTDGVGSKVTLKPGNVTLVAGKVTAQANTGIATSTEIKLDDNARLTIASGVQFPIWGGLSGSTGSTLVNGGTVTIMEGGSNNFYVSSSSTALDTITAGTYTWDTTAGGGSSAGWETPASS